MWILLAVVIKTISPNEAFPVYDKPLIYKSINECNDSMQKLYDEYKILQANYPVKVEFKINDNKQRFMIYSFKPDYTKPEIVTYYHCLRAFTKE